MTLNDLNPIIEILGHCKLKVFGSVVQLLDNNGKTMGEINFYEQSFTLYSTYEHCEVIEQRFKEAGYDLFDQELNRKLLHEVNEL